MVDAELEAMTYGLPSQCSTTELISIKLGFLEVQYSPTSSILLLSQSSCYLWSHVFELFVCFSKYLIRAQYIYMYILLHVRACIQCS